MTAQAAIILNDGATTPVAFTFDPKGAKTQADKSDLALWRNQSATSAVGFRTLSEKHVPINSNGMEKFRYTIDIPTLETASSGGSFAPPPTRAYGTIAVIEIWAHQRASEQELKDIVAFTRNFAASAYFLQAVSKREAAW